MYGYAYGGGTGGFPQPPRRTDTGTRTAFGIVALVLGVLLFLPLSAWSLYAVTAAVGDTRAYRSVPVCAPGEIGDCLEQASAIVRRTEIVDKGKQQTYAVRLDAAAPGRAEWLPGRLSLYDDGPLLSRLRGGDEVTVTRWRGEVTRIGRGDLTQESMVSPEHDRGFAAGVALVPLTLLLFLCWTAVHLLRPSRPAPGPQPSPAPTFAPSPARTFAPSPARTFAPSPARTFAPSLVLRPAPGGGARNRRLGGTASAGWVTLVVAASGILAGLVADGMTPRTADPAAVPVLTAAGWLAVVVLVTAGAALLKRQGERQGEKGSAAGRETGSAPGAGQPPGV